MAATSNFPTPFLDGPRLIDGTDLNRQLAAPKVSTADGLTALGTTRATAFVIGASWNKFDVVTASAAGALLPPSVPGLEIIIFNNDSGDNMTIYASGSDTIDGTAGATGVTLTHGNRCGYYCTSAGKWVSALLGAVSS